MNGELVSFKDLQNWLGINTKDAIEKWLIKNQVPFRPAPKGIVTTKSAVNAVFSGDTSGVRVIKTKSQ